MEFSLIVIDLKNLLNLDEFMAYIKALNINNEIIYCSSVKQAQEGIKNYVFNQNTNSEAVINAITKQCSKKCIVVIRDVNNYKKIGALIKEYNSSNQIIYFKQKQQGLKRFWFNLVKNTVGKVFMHNLLSIDYGVALYGEIASKVLRNINVPSILMRTNNWQGMRIILLEGGELYKFKYNKLEMAYKTFMPLLIAIVMLVLKLAINFSLFGPLNVLYFGLIVLFILMFLFFGGRWALKSVVGENITEKAKFD